MASKRQNPTAAQKARHMVMAEDSTMVPSSFYDKVSPAYRAAHPDTSKKAPAHDIGSDIRKVFDSTIHEVGQAVEKVKSGFRAVKKHMGG